MLNMVRPQLGSPLATDGGCGQATIALIRQYAHGVTGCSDPAGVITPMPPPAAATLSGSTLRALRACMPPGLTPEKLNGIYIDAPASTVAKYYTQLVAGMSSAGITTPLRQAHFLAQVGHESCELLYTEELASGTAYEGNLKLGNTQPGDGVRFKGRGLIQLTGRANYTAFGASAGRDFVTGDHPKLIATDPQLAVDAAIWFWKKHNLNAMADDDDVLQCTKCINGGTNGLEQREAMLARAKWFLMDPADDTASPVPAGTA